MIKINSLEQKGDSYYVRNELSHIKIGYDMIYNLIKEYAPLIEEVLDLKLYNIVYNQEEFMENYNLTSECFWNLFHDFCQIEYSYFENYLNDRKLIDCRRYIADSSRFYLVPDEIVIIGKSEVDYEETIITLFSYYGIFLEDLPKVTGRDNYFDIELVFQELMNLDDNIFSYFISNISEYRIEYEDILNIYIRIKSSLDNVKEIYTYIDEFKKNQVKLFEEFIKDWR